MTGYHNCLLPLQNVHDDPIGHSFYRKYNCLKSPSQTAVFWFSATNPSNQTHPRSTAFGGFTGQNRGGYLSSLILHDNIIHIFLTLHQLQGEDGGEVFSGMLGVHVRCMKFMPHMSIQISTVFFWLVHLSTHEKTSSCVA